MGNNIVAPTPTAAPFTAAIKGFWQLYIAKARIPPPSLWFFAAPIFSKDSCPPERSAPAQNPLPAPVIIIARTSS